MTKLEEFIQTWQARSTERVVLRSQDPGAPGKWFETAVPKYLFRGEKAIYDATPTSRGRFLPQYGGHEGGLACVIEHVDALQNALVSLAGLDHLHAEALLQHYDLPTNHFDLTTSPDVAAAFALYNRTSQDGAQARIFVFETAKLSACSRVLDLTGIDFARRPRHQLGYSMSFRRTGSELQSAARAARALVEECVFEPALEASEPHARLIKSIYGPANRDPVASFLNHLLTQKLRLEDQAGHRRCMEWIESRIPWTALAIGPNGSIDWDESYRFLETGEI